MASSRLDAEEASARWQVLRASTGAKVGELKDRLAEARNAASACERTLKAAEICVGQARSARSPVKRDSCLRECEFPRHRRQSLGRKMRAVDLH